MAKKLTIDIEANATKAKRAAKEIGDAAAEGMERAAGASERMANSMERAGSGFNLSSRRLASVAASMGGMLAGTAMKAVALRQGEDSPAAKALGWGGAGIQGAGMGAAMGSMFGPLGTAIGALAGAAQGLLNKWLDDEEAEKKKREAVEKTNAANRDMLDTMLAAEKRTREFRDMIDSLGNKERDLSERQREVAAEIEKRERTEKELQSAMRANSGQGANEGDQKLFAKQMRDYAANRGELDRLRSMQKALDRQDPTERFRASIAAPDSLARIGGDSGEGNDNFRELTRNAKDQLAVLKSIDSKTGKGGATWQ